MTNVEQDGLWWAASELILNCHDFILFQSCHTLVITPLILGPNTLPPHSFYTRHLQYFLWSAVMMMLTLWCRMIRNTSAQCWTVSRSRSWVCWSRHWRTMLSLVTRVSVSRCRVTPVLLDSCVRWSGAGVVSKSQWSCHHVIIMSTMTVILCSPAATPITGQESSLQVSHLYLCSYYQ